MDVVLVLMILLIPSSGNLTILLPRVTFGIWPLSAKFSMVRVEHCSLSATCFFVSNLPEYDVCFVGMRNIYHRTFLFLSDSKLGKIMSDTKNTAKSLFWGKCFRFLSS